MRKLTQASLFVAIVFAIAVANACASAGGAPRERCAGMPRDTIYRPVGMVYRSCAVDREARLATTPRSTFTPSPTGGQSCYSAEFEFVVDDRGKPIPETVRTLRANDRSFESSAANQIPGMTWEPASKDGHPVNQIVTWKSGASVMKVVVPAGAPVPKPSQRAPAC